MSFETSGPCLPPDPLNGGRLKLYSWTGDLPILLWWRWACAREDIQVVSLGDREQNSWAPPDNPNEAATDTKVPINPLLTMIVPLLNMKTGHTLPNSRENLTSQTDPKKKGGNQDNAGTKVTIKKTITSILGKIREDFACMGKPQIIILRCGQNTGPSRSKACLSVVGRIKYVCNNL